MTGYVLPFSARTTIPTPTGGRDTGRGGVSAEDWAVSGSGGGVEVGRGCFAVGGGNFAISFGENVHSAFRSLERVAQTEPLATTNLATAELNYNVFGLEILNLVWTCGERSSVWGFVTF